MPGDGSVRFEAGTRASSMMKHGNRCVRVADTSSGAAIREASEYQVGAAFDEQPDIGLIASETRTPWGVRM